MNVPVNNFEKLSYDPCALIFHHLPLQDVNNIGQTCEQMRQFAMKYFEGQCLQLQIKAKMLKKQYSKIKESISPKRSIGFIQEQRKCLRNIEKIRLRNEQTQQFLGIPRECRRNVWEPSAMRRLSFNA